MVKGWLPSPSPVAAQKSHFLAAWVPDDVMGDGPPGTLESGRPCFRGLETSACMAKRLQMPGALTNRSEPLDETTPPQVPGVHAHRANDCGRNHRHPGRHRHPEL